MTRYPFTPEVLDALPEKVAELFRALEDRLLQEICWRLNAANQLNEVTVQDIRALRAHGIELADIKKAIAETAGVGLDKVDELLDDVVERNQKYYSGVATAAKITIPERLISADDIDAIRRQTKGDLRNLTRSMGFAVRVGNRPVRWLPPAKAYQWALDMAESEVMSGAISYDQAITRAVKQLASGGLTTPEIKRARYENNGRVRYDQIDVAARRAVMTGVNQTCLRYSEQAVDRLQTDLVEVSAHAGARNTGSGPENHSSWQGKIYHWSRDGKPNRTRYPDFEKATGYGRGEGLGGWNCRHTYYPYIDGVMERTYTDKQLETIDRKPFVYQDRLYDQYQATQKQREIERAIRKQKRIINSMGGLDSEEAKKSKQEATIRLRRLNANYKAFSEKAGLPLQRERTKVLY